MRTNRLNIHERCYELESKLAPLYVFSSKLKHLQLSYKQYSNLLNEIKRIMNKHTLDCFGDEYYVMEIERCILELLVHIFSIGDILKESKILCVTKFKSDKDENLMALVKKLSNNLPQEEILLSNLAKRMRNKLLHHNLQNTRFNTINAVPQYGEAHQDILIMCDYEHFIKEVLKWEMDNHAHTWRYFLDEHLILLMYASLVNPSGEQFKELAYRCNHLGFASDYNNLHAIKAPTIILPTITYYDEIQSRTIRQHVDIYNKFLSNIDYRLFSYNEYKAKKQIDSKIKPHVKMRFNIGKSIEDIYQLYWNYYSKLHNLIFEEQCINLKEFSKLQIELGYDNYVENEFKCKYSYEMPINRFAIEV